MKFIPILAIILLSAWGTLGDSFLKISGESSKFTQVKFFLLGIIIYALSAFGWFYVLKHIKLSSVGFVYSVSTSLLLVTIGGLYFKETLGVREIIGIATSIVSIALLARFN